MSLRVDFRKSLHGTSSFSREKGNKFSLPISFCNDGFVVATTQSPMNDAFKKKEKKARTRSRLEVGSIMHCRGNARRGEMQDSETNVLKGSILVAGGSDAAALRVRQRLDWRGGKGGQVISLAEA